MPRFTFKASVTDSNGTTRTETGTVSQPTEMLTPARARIEVANHLRRTTGGTPDTDNIELRRS